MVRFKNTKLESLCVRATLLIQAYAWPHQPRLVSSVLVIGKSSPQPRVVVLGIGKQSAQSVTIVHNDIIGEIMGCEAR